MDALSLKAAFSEASRRLRGRRLTDAFQASATDVFLALGRGPGLLLSTHAEKGGLYLDDRNTPAPLPTSMTDLLRARIRGSVLTDLALPEPGERVLHLTLAAGWPDRQGSPVLVVLEVMGRRSNLMIVEEGRVLAALKTVPHEKSRVRPVIPGNRYKPPPTLPGVPLEEVDRAHLPRVDSASALGELMTRIRDLSPFTAAQALAKAQGPGSRTLRDVLQDMHRSATGERGYLLQTRGKLFLTPFEPLKNEEDDVVERMEPFSTAALVWRNRLEGPGKRAKEPADTLAGSLEERILRLTSSLNHLELEKERCRAFDKTRRMAEILLINASRVRQGLASVTLPDPFNAGEPVTLPLDPGLSALDNAQRLFSTARRLERGLAETEVRRKGIGKEIQRAEEALAALREGGDPEKARKILGRGLETRDSRRESRAEGHRGPGRRHVIDGFTVLVGKGAADNEKVTFQAAGPNDLWFHARDYPGSHVVILTERQPVPDKVLYEAAALAAAGSGAKNDTAPEIMVTERKWVRKLKGGKPGQVTVEKFRTIRARSQKSGDRN